jgi:hypothetical protein
MDLVGVAAVIASSSGLVVALTGTVVALRVTHAAVSPEPDQEHDQSTSQSLPRPPPKPGGDLANELYGLPVSHAESTTHVSAGHTAWLERMIGWWRNALR